MNGAKANLVLTFIETLPADSRFISLHTYLGKQVLLGLVQIYRQDWLAEMRNVD